MTTMEEVMGRIFAAAMRTASRDGIELGEAVERHLAALAAEYPEIHAAIGRAISPA